jgi:protein gp37
MAGKSAIEWTEQTWNPIVGCSIVSPGCINCYAMKEAYRFGFNPQLQRYHGLTKNVNGNAVWTGKLAIAPDSTFLQPRKRKTPTTYFVNSMGDLFHEDCHDDCIDRVFAVMALSPQHTFQVLTKRAERMRGYMSDPTVFARIHSAAWSMLIDRNLHISPPDWPLPNVWLGVSTERQQEADERIPLLLQTPAAVSFISAEPLLGPIDLIGTFARFQDDPVAKRLCAVPLGRQLLDWVIVGGESGTGARPMHPAWARSLRDQCLAAGMPFFFKQWGEWAPSTPDQAKGNPRSGWRTIKAHPHVARAEELYPEAGAEFIEHFGKKAAGRLLDGVEHNGFPARPSS